MFQYRLTVSEYVTFVKSGPVQMGVKKQILELIYKFSCLPYYPLKAIIRCM